MTETPIGQALYEEAQRSILAKFPIRDVHADGDAMVETRVDLKVKGVDHKLTVVAEMEGLPVGMIVIGLTGGELTVLAYDEDHDEPVVLTITRANITVSANRSR